jgi:SAM-dependent methyltransferase
MGTFSDADALIAHLGAIDATVPGQPERERLAQMRRFVEEHRGGIARVRQMGALHAKAEAEGAALGVAGLGRLYDQLAALDPDTAVALYSFGDAGILAEATREVVAYLDGAGLLTPERRLLDLGCGIGRLLEACARRYRSAEGIDVSPAMVELASWRVSGLANARATLGNGLDLLAFADGSFDVVLASDSWPHVVMLGPDAVDRLAAEVARVLAPAGAFVVLNYSYRGDEARDAADVARLAARHGLDVVESGARPFRLWDAVVFRLRRGLR